MSGPSRGRLGRDRWPRHARLGRKRLRDRRADPSRRPKDDDHIASASPRSTIVLTPQSRSIVVSLRVARWRPACWLPRPMSTIRSRIDPSAFLAWLFSRASRICSAASPLSSDGLPLAWQTCFSPLPLPLPRPWARPLDRRPGTARVRSCRLLRQRIGQLESSKSRHRDHLPR